MLGLSLSILESKNHMMNHLIILFVGRKQDGNKSNNTHAHGSDTGTYSTSSVGISCSNIAREAHKSSYRVYTTTAATGRVIRKG